MDASMRFAGLKQEKICDMISAGKYATGSLWNKGHICSTTDEIEETRRLCRMMYASSVGPLEDA